MEGSFLAEEPRKHYLMHKFFRFIRVKEVSRSSYSDGNEGGTALIRPSCIYAWRVFLFIILQEVKMSKELNKTYDPKDIEDRLYEKWEENGYFLAEVDRSKKPFTIVMPPPNITGQLHMGHALDNTMQDILTRYKRMQGYSALW